MTRNEGTGGVVWVCCEHGHVDLLHRRSALDLCCTCREGSCEPRATLGRRSKEQRALDRELAKEFPTFAESLKNPRPAPSPPTPSEVTVSSPGRAATIVPAEDFERPAPVAPFDLTADQRRALLDAESKPPRIAFPRNAPADHPAGQPWPASKGDVVQVTAKVRLVVLGLRYLVNEIEVQYEIHDDRPNLPDSVKAFKPFDPRVPYGTLGSQQGEREPDPPSRAETSRLADQVHEAELRKLRRAREQHGDNLTELADQPRDVRWPIRKAIEALDARIEEIERQLRNSQHRKEVDRRRQAGAAA